MCQGPDRPTAIVTTWDPTAEMIYLLLERLGLRVPQDISLVCEAGPSRQGAIARKLSSVIVEEEEIRGQTAVPNARRRAHRRHGADRGAV